MNFLDRSDLDQAVTEQILHLRSALQSANRTLELRVEERTAELQKALERVSELSQLKANFISNISHELRTPLTHIKGYIELLVTETLGSITEEQRHALTVSQQSTGRLEGLIEDLIMVSLASRGELSIKQEKVDIRRLANLSAKAHADAALDAGSVYMPWWMRMSHLPMGIRKRSPGCWVSSPITGSNSRLQEGGSSFPSDGKGKIW